MNEDCNSYNWKINARQKAIHVAITRLKDKQYNESSWNKIAFTDKDLTWKKPKDKWPRSIIMHKILKQTSALWSQMSEMLGNTENTSLKIVLVKVFCDCSWFILKCFSGLVYYGSSKGIKRPTGKVFQVIPFETCRPVQYPMLVSCGLTS